MDTNVSNRVNEPYYFPKLRDGIIKRTLFINSNEAIISNSVGNDTEDMVNIYVNDLNVILALKKEFNKLKELYLKRKELMLNNLNNYYILDIMSVTTDFSKNIPYSFLTNVFYTKENYLKHLKNILDMLIRYKNYYVILKSDNLAPSSIYIKEDSELIIEKNDNTSLLFSNEFNIIKAFWEYYIFKKENDKSKTIAMLKDIIKTMEEQ